MNNPLGSRKMLRIDQLQYGPVLLKYRLVEYDLSFLSLRLYNYFNDQLNQMSVSKRRAQKSINHSNLSQISNSQNMRDSSMFKNYALADIQNIPCHNQSKSSRKTPQQQSSTKKPPTKKQPAELRTKSKENQKYKQNRATINYTGISKIVEEKNVLIHTQERQIDSLKGSLERVRKELELTRIQFDRKKMEDLTALRKHQQDNQDNIKELQILRVGMRQLKNRIECLQTEKAHLSKKSHQYLRQNQQLTIKLATLKQQLSSSPQATPQTLQLLTHQLSILKQQQKQTKQLQCQKSAQEQRCRGLQRKINEYILRYNEIQADHNQTMIKYYRAQKDNDDLKMQMEELGLELRNCRKVLEEERRYMGEVMDKWKSRIIRLEDLQKTDRNHHHPIAQLQQRCLKLQQSEIQQKLQQKTTKISQQQCTIASLTTELTTTKSDLTAATLANQSLTTRLAELEDLYQQVRIQKEDCVGEIQRCGVELGHMRARIGEYEGKEREGEEKIAMLQQQICMYVQQLNILSQQLTQTHHQTACLQHQLQLQSETLCTNSQNYQSLTQATTAQVSESMHHLALAKQEILALEGKLRDSEQKCGQLGRKMGDVEEVVRVKEGVVGELRVVNQKLNEDVRQVANLLKIKNTQLQQLQHTISQQSQQLSTLQTTITTLTTHSNTQTNQIQTLTNQLSTTTHQLQTLQQTHNTLQSTLSQTQSSLLLKLQVLEHEVRELQGRNGELVAVVEARNCQIGRLEAVVGCVNGELRDIRDVVKQYKDRLEYCAREVDEADRRYQNQLYLTKQQQLKWQQQTNYYKSKHEQNFKKTQQLTTTIQNLQTKLVDQVNKTTQQIKIINTLQSQLQKLHESKSVLELSTLKEIQGVNGDYARVKAELVDVEMRLRDKQGRLTDMEERLRDMEGKIREKEEKVRVLEEECSRLVLANMKLKEDYAMLSYEQLRTKQENTRLNSLNITIQQQNTRLINQMKGKHQQQIQQLSKKYQETIKHQAELSTLRYQKMQRSLTDRLESQTIQVQNLQKQCSQKTLQLHTLTQTLSTTKAQLAHSLNLQQSHEQSHQQSQTQLLSTKQSLSILTQQLQQKCQQYDKIAQELQEITQQCQKYRSSINGLEREVIALQGRNVELGNQAVGLRAGLYRQGEDYERVVGDMRAQLGTAEERIRIQLQEISVWVQKYENVDKELKKMQSQCNRANRNFLDQSNRKNKQNSRQIQNYRTQVRLLQQQNLNLQRVMDKELGKRKAIIEQLIHQKKILYEQMGRS